MTNLYPVRRALISVSDKTGLIGLAKALSAGGIEILSTGGSAKAIRDAGIDVRDVADVTGFPEMMDGRVKTLHPMVHGGLLALRDNDDHTAAMEQHGIGGIDLLIVNLYPFEETVAKGADYDTCIENIDIGGPAMIRAAAKNHGFVTTVVDVEDYEELLAELAAHEGQTTYARSAKRWRNVPMPARGPMMRRYQLGWPLRLVRKRPAAALLRGRLRNTCVMVKTRTHPLPFMWMERIARVLRPRSSTKAKSCHTTTLTIRMPRLNWCQSLDQMPVRHARLSNMPTHAA